MSKTCLNCGREISGEGKNKVFCNDCFTIMASFLRRLPSSNESAMTVYERTKPDFPAMGIGEKAALYLEKCCIRYDEGNAAKTGRASAASASSSSGAKTPVSRTNDEGSADDYPDPIPLPRRRHAAQMREPQRSTGSSDLHYDINMDMPENKNSASTQMFSYTEQSPTYEEYQYREYSEAAAAVEAEQMAAAKAKSSAKSPSGGGSMHAGKGAVKNEYDDEGDDEYSYDTVTAGASAPADTKRRLYLIIAAAVTAVILFAILAFSGLLTGNYKPKPPVNGSDSDSASGNGGVVIPPAGTNGADTDDITDSYVPDDSTSPATTETPVTTNPVVDPATCLHQWTQATCTEASVCTICGAVNGAPLGHSFSAPTCTEHGKCVRCGVVNTADTLAAHDYAPATCTEPQTCRMCGATRGSVIDHDYAPATCTKPQTCRMCGATKGDALGHDYADATCTEPQTCKVCGATKGEALGHDYTAAPTFEWNDEDFTCTYTLVCTRDASHTTDGGAATVTHETTTAPTCETPGVETYTATATVNGTTYMWSEKLTQEIPANGTHTYEEGSLVCSVCGERAGGFQPIGITESGTQYHNTGMYVNVVYYSRGNMIYTLDFRPDGESCDEGTMKLVVKSGDEIKLLSPNYDPSDDRGAIQGGDIHSHIVTFDIEDGDEPLFLEYHDTNFSESKFWSDDKNSALYWMVDGQ